MKTLWATKNVNEINGYGGGFGSPTLSASGTSIKRLAGRFFVALIELACPTNSD